MPSPEPRLVAYIDEAGCAGDQYGNGSSHFLAIGATVFAIADEPQILSLFNEARTERNHSRPFRKFSKNPDKDNFVLTRLLATKRIRTVQVALHKPSMAGTFLRQNHKEEYQYLIKFALERVSWIARDSARQRGGRPEENQCRIVFSEQRLYSYHDLCTYLNRLQNGQERFNCSIEWPYIHETFTSQRHADEAGIHLADIVASALHKAVEPKQHGMTDDRFQRNLADVIYRKGDRPFGLKLFPPREIEQMRQAGQFGFLASL